MPAMPKYLVAHDLAPELRDLELAGRLAEAEDWIDEALRGLPTDPAHPLAIERQRLARVRRDYSQTSERLLEVVRQSIPDATADDLERWRQAGHLQAVEIDGAIGYFRREPRNLFRFSQEARRRRDEHSGKTASAPAGDPNAGTTKRYDLHEHVEGLIREAEETDSAAVGGFRIHATHRVTVGADAVPPGETIRCWIPFPQEYERQSEVELLESAPPVLTIAPNGTAQRTVYLEGTAVAGEPSVFSVSYAYTLKGFVPKLDPAKVPLPTEDLRGHYLASRPPHLELTPEVQALAREIVGEERNPLLAAEKLFRWMDANIRYSAEMEYSTLASITDKVMTERKGDCGIHALLFIALCRASGIPARWQSGWAMRPGAENLHDWAEFYVEPWGWLPADPSYGRRNHPNPQVRDFYFGHLDAFRMIANLDYEAPFIPAKTHWRSDNIDNQRGEVEWAGGNLYYDQWDYDMEATYEPLEAPVEANP